MYYDVAEFFLDYGPFTLIAAAVVAAISVLLDKVVFEKILKRETPYAVKNYAPLALSLVCAIASDMVVNGRFAVTSEGVYLGLLIGTLSTAAVVAVKKIMRHEPVSAGVTALFIEGILGGIVNERDLPAVAALIAAVLDNAAEESEKEKEIDEILRERSEKELSQTEREALIKTIKECAAAEAEKRKGG